MPCICHGAVTGNEELDRMMKSNEGRVANEALKLAAKYIRSYHVSVECYASEFHKAWIQAFTHHLNGCPEHGGKCNGKTPT